MRSFKQLAFVLFLLASSPVRALVGASDAPGPAARHTVMVLKQQQSGAAYCSGVVVADRAILTAAHCVAGARGIAIYVPGAVPPKLYEARTVAIHPGYVPNAIRTRKRSIDLALVRTGEALPAALSQAAISARDAFAPGSPLRIAGFGLRTEGREKSAGTLRSARLVVREPISTILLWARGASPAIGGACTGDSGGPIFSDDFAEVAAITTWARGKGSKHCGELTQGVLLAPQRAWINSVLAKWGTR
ncbi:MAG: trypsin-like serine protease [Beijerinckiaceae bacterium]